MKQGKIVFECFNGYEFILLVGGDYKTILRVAKSLSMSEKTIGEIISECVTSQDGGAVYWCFDTGSGIVWFPKKTVDRRVLSHEATHMVDYLLQHIGATLEMETRAYLHDWLITILPKKLKKVSN